MRRKARHLPAINPKVNPELDPVTTVGKGGPGVQVKGCERLLKYF